MSGEQDRFSRAVTAFARLSTRGEQQADKGDRMTEYSDENPLSTDDPRVGHLLEAIHGWIEPAVSCLGEFGIVMSMSTDGTINAHFGPNMTVDWDYLDAHYPATA